MVLTLALCRERQKHRDSARSILLSQAAKREVERVLMLIEECPDWPGLKVLTPSGLVIHEGSFRKAGTSGCWQRTDWTSTSFRTTIPFRPGSAPFAGCISSPPPTRRPSWSVVAGGGCSTWLLMCGREARPSGKWFGIELSFENGKQLLVPAGFLHGFATRDPDTEIVYKCTDYYVPAADGGDKL